MRGSAVENHLFKLVALLEFRKHQASCDLSLQISIDNLAPVCLSKREVHLVDILQLWH